MMQFGRRHRAFASLCGIALLCGVWQLFHTPLLKGTTASKQAIAQHQEQHQPSFEKSFTQAPTGQQIDLTFPPTLLIEDGEAFDLSSQSLTIVLDKLLSPWGKDSHYDSLAFAEDGYFIQYGSKAWENVEYISVNLAKKRQVLERLTHRQPPIQPPCVLISRMGVDQLITVLQDADNTTHLTTVCHLISSNVPNASCPTVLPGGPRLEWWKDMESFARYNLTAHRPASRRPQKVFVAQQQDVQVLQEQFGNSTWLSTLIKDLHPPPAVSSRIDWFRGILTSAYTVILSQPNKGRRKASTPTWVRLLEVVEGGSIPIVIFLPNKDDGEESLSSYEKRDLTCTQYLWLEQLLSDPLDTDLLKLSSVDNDFDSAVLRVFQEESTADWDARQARIRSKLQAFAVSHVSQWESLVRLPPAPTVPIRQHALQQQIAQMATKRLEQESIQQTEQAMSAPMTERKDFSLPYCLEGRYGGTNNRILSLSRLLFNLQQEQQQQGLAVRKVGLSDEWSEFVRKTFDLDNPLLVKHVLLDYYPRMPCHVVVRGQKAYYSPAPFPIPPLLELLPRKDYRLQAQHILSRWKYGRSYISIHRRDLSGSCERHANCVDYDKKSRTCLKERPIDVPCGQLVHMDACHFTFTKFQEQYQAASDSSNSLEVPSVLFTDHQAPKYDDTFPNHFDDQNKTIPFLTEMWLMAMSDLHFGNPRSTVDTVVFHWRLANHRNRSTMFPQECYSLGHDPVLDHAKPVVSGNESALGKADDDQFLLEE